jgi:hypothetical protein
LTDSQGNLYQLAVGPTVTGSRSQSIYYAKNISSALANANSVKVTFSLAATYPDIRILEYSGIDPANPVDAVIGATGNSAVSSSGSLKTTNATDLLLAANCVQTSTAGGDAGFTQRMLTNPNGDIVEDRVVTLTGSYGVNTPLNGTGAWVMQVSDLR